jgi:cytoplasmic iron level regulating protein YaaA (DUF328/UPF0246 family)
MLLLLSPAKTLDYDTRVPATVARRATDPLFANQAAELVGLLRQRSASEVAALMALSEALATLNVDRYRAWAPLPTPHNSKPALLAFAGDVYEGLQAHSLRTADLDWAQQHLVILSGLYGALRPLDRLQPYRLEMGTALPNPRGRDLYAWWGDQIAAYLNQRLAGDARPVVLNLASQEYARAALRPALKARVIDCVFEDWHGDRYKLISFFAKRARGLMARWVIEQRLRSPARLAEFAVDGYAHAAAESTPQRLVFRRRQG